MKKKTFGLLMLLMSFGLMWGMTGQRAQAAKKANVKVTLKNGETKTIKMTIKVK